MKKIVALAVGLLVINSSSIMGMMGRGPQENRVLQRTTETHRPLTKKAKKRQIQREETIKWKTQQNIKTETIVLAFGKIIGCLLPMAAISAVLQSSEIASRNKSVCFDETMINALWAVHILTTARSFYEIYTEKPLFKSRSKNMLLAGGQFAASAAPMICSAMVDGCYNAPLNCIELRKAHAVANLLVAGYCLYQASLNK
jgi:hypothetical protein